MKEKERGRETKREEERGRQWKREEERGREAGLHTIILGWKQTINCLQDNSHIF